MFHSSLLPLTFVVPEIPRRALFADTWTSWKKRRGGQCMTYCRGIKESYTGLASVDPSKLPG